MASIHYINDIPGNVCNASVNYYQTGNSACPYVANVNAWCDEGQVNQLLTSRGFAPSDGMEKPVIVRENGRQYEGYAAASSFAVDSSYLGKTAEGWDGHYLQVPLSKSENARLYLKTQLTNGDIAMLEIPTWSIPHY